jgi:hypothetical protein
MRTLVSRSLWTVITLATAAGCSSSSTPAGPTTNAACVGFSATVATGTGTMTAQLNGASWTAACIAVATATPGAMSLQGVDTLPVSANSGHRHLWLQRRGHVPSRANL